MDTPRGDPPADDGRTAASWRRRTLRWADRYLSVGGPSFRTLVLANSASTAGDTLVAIALAGTLFFSVPSAEARANVALYLLLTLAPFIVLAPLLGALLARWPTAYRHGLVVAAAARALVAVLLAAEVASLWLYPLAFALLVLSRLHTVSRASLLPVALSGPTTLVAANARLAQIGMVAGAAVAPVGVLAIRTAAPWLALFLAAAAFVVAAITAHELPPPPTGPAEAADLPPTRMSELVRSHKLPRSVRFAQLATGGVRLLNGFLLLLLAFAFRRTDAGLLDFGALVAAGGAGFTLASVVSPWLERRLREEPMVVVALAVEAGAAFVTAQVFGVASAAILAAAAGFAWGIAKFAFDGLLQAATPSDGRGVAFTRSETVFAIAWVLGAIVPVSLPVPTAAGLSAAGVAALAAQVVYVSGLLMTPGPLEKRRGYGNTEPAATDGESIGHASGREESPARRL